WKTVSPYRGQNANMHSCEALIAAYQATAEKRYLERALLLAHNICVRQTQTTQGQIWEHYDLAWQVDWQYNKDDPKNLFRPWGYQPGHFTEWAKLLLILDRYKPQIWLVETAQSLFDQALEKAWDHDQGGICYGFAPDGEICDDDKYFWVQAESMAAAALLAEKTGEQRYWDWYEKFWAYVWEHFVDHQYGAWYRILNRNNAKYDDLKSPAGKTDYHTMGACYEVINNFRLMGG
nr:AGE family epimerase/isomerase [Oceanospirillaceae bacterium]